jgi:hypothetical protein
MWCAGSREEVDEQRIGDAIAAEDDALNDGY